MYSPSGAVTTRCALLFGFRYAANALETVTASATIRTTASRHLNVSATDFLFSILFSFSVLMSDICFIIREKVTSYKLEVKSSELKIDKLQIIFHLLPCISYEFN